MYRPSCIDRDGSEEKETSSYYKTKNVFIKIAETWKSGGQESHQWEADGYSWKSCGGWLIEERILHPVCRWHVWSITARGSWEWCQSFWFDKGVMVMLKKEEVHWTLNMSNLICPWLPRGYIQKRVDYRDLKFSWKKFMKYWNFRIISREIVCRFRLEIKICKLSV